MSTTCDPMRSCGSALGPGLVAGLAVAAVAAMALLICYALGRLVLDRRRLAAWESAWNLTGPRWTTRR